MIKDLNDKEVDVEGFFKMDDNVPRMVELLLSEINKAKLNKFSGDEVAANYYTYEFLFPYDLMIIWGLTLDEPVYAVKLTDFISKLQELKKLNQE